MTPATYGCRKCDAKYDMGDETTVYLYMRQPWFNHIVTVCPGCGTTYRDAWAMAEGTVRYLEKHNMKEGDELNWSLEDFAPSIVQQLFAEDNDKPLVQSVQRSARREAHDEAEIAFFHFLLERGEMPNANIPVQRHPGRTEASQRGVEGLASGTV